MLALSTRTSSFFKDSKALRFPAREFDGLNQRARGFGAGATFFSFSFGFEEIFGQVAAACVTQRGDTDLNG